MAKQDIKVVEARRALDVVQSMIDISANRLEGLRTQCAPSAELTQHEIRTLEGKLVRLYSQMLVSKSKYLSEGTLPASDLKNIPSLRQWLQVVGLTPDAITGVCNRVTTLEGLQEKSDHELQGMLIEQQARDEDLRRLTKSLHNLRRYQVNLLTELRGKCNHVDEINDTEPLHWDSWERNHSVQSLPTVGLSPRQPRTRTSRCSVPSEDFVPYNNNNYSYSTNSLAGSVTSSTSSSVNSLPLLGGGTPTHAPLSPPVQPVYPSSTPPSTPPVNKGKAGDRMKFKIFPTTPPPRRKHQTGIHSSPQQHQHNQIPQDQLAEELQNLESLQSIEQRQLQQQQLAQQVQNALGDSQTLTKSKSHESQLGNRVEGGDGNHAGGDGNGSNMNGPWPRRGRLPTEPGPDLGQTSPLLTSPIKSPPYNSTDSDDSSFKSGSLQVPKSPRTTSISRGVGHVIPHRFTKTFKMNTSCDLCSGSMFYGLKCKECKYKCHSNCAPKVPPSCGLSRELVDEFKKTLSAEGYMNQSPSMSRPSPSHIPNNLLRKDRKRTHPQPSIQVPPFQQGSDSTSNTSSCNSSTPSSPALIMQQHPSSAAPSTIQQSFNFPDVPSSQGITLNTHPLTAPPALEEILDSHKAQKEGVSMDSDKTISVSGSGSISTDSERTPVRVDSQDSQVSDGEAVENRGWPRQNSLSMREWDIPFDELNLGEPIGTGHFGTVFRGNWHGDVAIKVLNMDYMDDEKTIESFKLEVATFRKTRHENLVLFMGACMKPPRLAIVTSMCKGLTLYTHIHLRKDKFNMNRTTMVAQQISQGMGYLHARGIVHKDLKSKNIFLENGKVVITDFGLFSVTKLCFGNRKGDGLSIPPGWLCYLAPEIMCSLKANQKQGDEELPFSKASDVYAFGTVWYELLCGEWPFKAQPPEAIIWQVGKGMKQTLANLQASRDVKDILMSCWSYKPEDRPDFIRLLKTLEKLPKKRLARSPSHPIHLSRSAESVF